MVILFDTEAFKSFLNDFLINLFASLVWTIIAFVAGILFTRLQTALYRHYVKKITRFTVHGRSDTLYVTSIYANSGKKDAGEAVNLGYPFEYMANAMIESFLLSINKHLEMRSGPGPITKREVEMTSKDSNIILLGGPFHNLITGHIFGLLKDYHTVPFYFDSLKREDGSIEEASLIHIEDENKPLVNGENCFIPEKDADGRYYRTDYALIMNVVNPFNPKKRIISFIGCRSIGVFGAALFYTKNRKEIIKKVKFDEYALVVKVNGEQDNIIGEPKLLKTYKLDSIDISKISTAHLKDLKVIEIKGK